jgi:hypothetical protein
MNDPVRLDEAIRILKESGDAFNRLPSDTPLDSDQRQDVIVRLYALWERHPQLRLGQLIENANFNNGLYSVDDMELIYQLERFYKKNDNALQGRMARARGKSSR